MISKTFKKNCCLGIKLILIFILTFAISIGLNTVYSHGDSEVTYSELLAISAEKIAWPPGTSKSITKYNYGKSRRFTSWDQLNKGRPTDAFIMEWEKRYPKKHWNFAKSFGGGPAVGACCNHFTGTTVAMAKADPKVTLGNSLNVKSYKKTPGRWNIFRYKDGMKLQRGDILIVHRDGKYSCHVLTYLGKDLSGKHRWAEAALNRDFGFATATTKPLIRNYKNLEICRAIGSRKVSDAEMAYLSDNPNTPNMPSYKGKKDGKNKKDGKTEKNNKSKKNGLIWKSSVARYYINGVPIKSKWKVIDGHYHYFDKHGIMVTGLKYIKGKPYFFSIAGRGFGKGWLGKHTYYSVGKGKLALGWRTVAKKRYYFQKSGKKSIGCTTIGKKKYYFNKDGSLANKGWKKNKTYYVVKNGELAKGWKKIGKKKYYFYKSGKRANGVVKIGKYRYYFNKNGMRTKPGKFSWKGKKYICLGSKGKVVKK